MNMIPNAFGLTAATLAEIEQQSLRRDVTPDALISTLLTGAERAGAPYPRRRRWRRTARPRLASTLAQASNWLELQRRLNDLGYAVQADVTGLVVSRHPGGPVIRTISDFGFSHL